MVLLKRKQIYWYSKLLCCRLWQHWAIREWSPRQQGQGWWWRRGRRRAGVQGQPAGCHSPHRGSQVHLLRRLTLPFFSINTYNVHVHVCGLDVRFWLFSQIMNEFYSSTGGQQECLLQSVCRKYLWLVKECRQTLILNLPEKSKWKLVTVSFTFYSCKCNLRLVLL